MLRIHNQKYNQLCILYLGYLAVVLFNSGVGEINFLELQKKKKKNTTTIFNLEQPETLSSAAV